MRTIKRTRAFKRDYRRENRGHHARVLETGFRSVVDRLANDRPLAGKHRDHQLAGAWNDYRECHVLWDLLLIYCKPDDRTLQLVRLGSHRKLGL